MSTNGRVPPQYTYEAAYKRADFESCIRLANGRPGMRPAILKAQSYLKLREPDKALDALQKIAPLASLAPSSIKAEYNALKSVIFTTMRSVDASRDMLDYARIQAFHSESLSAEASYLHAEMLFAISEHDLESATEYANEVLSLKSPSPSPISVECADKLKEVRVRTLITLAYVEALSGNPEGHLAYLSQAHGDAAGLENIDAMLYAQLLSAMAIAERDFGPCGPTIDLQNLADSSDIWPDSTSHFRAELYRSNAWRHAQRGQYDVALIQLRKSTEVTEAKSAKTLGTLQQAFFSKELGETTNAFESLDRARRLSESSSWSRPHEERTTLAQLAQEISSFNPEQARQIFARFRRSNGTLRDGTYSHADKRFQAHELIAEAVVLKNSGCKSSAVGLLLRAFSIWTDLNYRIYAAWAAVELAELNASPRFLEFANAEAEKFPLSWIAKRCNTLNRMHADAKP